MLDALRVSGFYRQGAKTAAVIDAHFQTQESRCASF
jgi:hypothetical protein